MLRFFLVPFLLVSCSVGVVNKGGERSYIYSVESHYTSEDLSKLSPAIVKTSTRDPQIGKLDQLFGKGMPPLNKIGILVFEIVPQPTLSGLSGHDRIYLSASGKQLLAEKFLSIWEESLPIIAFGTQYVDTEKVRASEVLKKYGSEVEDYVKVNRKGLATDDIFYLPPGKKTAIPTVLNPRGMRDFSLLLVPAGELMEGPKFSEHQKHAVNELARELGLDSVLIILNKVSWTAAHTDKHSGEFIPEEVSLKITATNLVSFSQYHDRLKKLGIKGDYPKVSVPFRTYEASLELPVLLSVAPGDENFETIERELVNPMLKAYKDLSQMVIHRISADLKATR